MPLESIGTRVGTWSVGQNALDRQYILSGSGLAAQTISGPVSGQLMVREYATADNVTGIYTTIRVLDSTCTTEKGILFSLKDWGILPTTPEIINNVSHRNKYIATGNTVNPVTVSNGDRLVIEIGYYETGGASHEASALWGAVNGVTDLPVNQTQTTFAGV